MKKHIKRGLRLNRETLRYLSGDALAGAQGGLVGRTDDRKCTMASSLSEDYEGPTYCIAPNCPHPYNYT